MSLTHIIAEAGTNHNGNLDTALKLVQAAANCKADSVKFQIIYPETLYVSKLFQGDVTVDNPVIAQRRAQMLGDDDYRKINDQCRAAGIRFSASVFDHRGVDLLCHLDVPYIKIASTDLNNLSLLRYAAATGRPLVISTGFSTLEEILRSVDEVEKAGCHDLVVMHCVSLYPASLRLANLQFIDQLREKISWPIGFSDHTPDSLAAAIALAKGCRWFEKHITLDKNQDGFDHHYALEPDEFAAFVKDLNDADKACALKPDKISEEEKSLSLRARRSLYATRDMKAGESLVAEDILVVRPTGHYSAADIDRIIGRKLKKDIAQYRNITPEYLS